MTKVFALNNFILLIYKRKVEDEPLPKNYSFTREEYTQYLMSQDKIFEFAKYQIQKFYPKCHTHILSNKKHTKDNNNITHHFMEFLPNHNVKSGLFGLLNEPAMYLDLDILINYKFTADQLTVSAPFNCYRCRVENIQEMSSVPLPCQVNNIFNSGLIWIPRPSQEIVQELNEIQSLYFSNKEWLLAHNKWLNNDEWALSVYIYKHKMKMKLLPEVNLARRTGDIPKCQSIHYSGVIGKKLMFKEVPYLRNLNT